jgi:hypothetical protein
MLTIWGVALVAVGILVGVFLPRLLPRLFAGQGLLPNVVGIALGRARRGHAGLRHLVPAAVALPVRAQSFLPGAGTGGRQVEAAVTVSPLLTKPCRSSRTLLCAMRADRHQRWFFQSRVGVGNHSDANRNQP